MRRTLVSLPLTMPTYSLRARNGSRADLMRSWSKSPLSSVLTFDRMVPRVADAPKSSSELLVSVLAPQPGVRGSASWNPFPQPGRDSSRNEIELYLMWARVCCPRRDPRAGSERPKSIAIRRAIYIPRCEREAERSGRTWAGPHSDMPHGRGSALSLKQLAELTAGKTRKMN